MLLYKSNLWLLLLLVYDISFLHATQCSCDEEIIKPYIGLYDITRNNFSRVNK